MKKILSLAILLGAIHLASAGSTNIYVENWGTGNSGVTGNGNINTVGWTGVAGSQTAGPYLGIYGNTDGPVDATTGAPLPTNTVYFTTLTTPNQVGPGMFYTTSSSGSGLGGNSTFTNIDPTTATNLTLNVEVAGANNATNYFAVMVGGQWYVSVTPMVGLGAGGDTTFTNASLPYTNIATAWNTLTVGTTNVTIGTQAGSNLSGPITGVGIVELPTTGGWDYNQFSISVFAPNPPPPTPATITANPISQTVYAGGGASFRMSAAGTAPITYIWQTNTVTLGNGSKYAGAGTNLLVISNCNAGDAAATYGVIVTNAGGGATNAVSFSLTVNPVPQGWFYAETYPYVGPGGNLPLTGVGWATAITGGGSIGIFSAGVGLGEVFAYSGTATTNACYTTDTNDVGQSGLPFIDINPASYPAVTLQAAFSPGNGAGTVAGNVTVYWAVQMNGIWYSSVKPIPINISMQNNYLTNQLGFNPAATNWNNLTIAGNAVTIGSQASGALSGNITGAGMVFTYPNTAGASMNWANFAITTNAVSILAPKINTAIGLYNQSVATGGGASFAVATSAGTQPFTYHWSLNNVMLTNGGRISGANSPTVTIANCTTNDTDTSIGMSGNVIAYVSNSIGLDESDTYLGVSLIVTNAPVGQLYSETFPYAGPSGNQPISSVGWTEAISGTPNSLFERTALTGDGADFAFLGSAGTTVYYATTSSDTNQSGVPFPNINLAYYPSLTFSVDIAPSFNASNMTAYIAVRLGATNWYVNTNPLPVPAVTSATYSTYTMGFDPTAANWANLTVTSSGGLVGSAAASNLSGTMTGAGVVFKNTGSGTFNFDNFLITGTGLGGINVGALSGGNVNLSWVGNPAVNLQSATNLTTPIWLDVPNTLGASSFPAPTSGPQMFFRLVQH